MPDILKGIIKESKRVNVNNIISRTMLQAVYMTFTGSVLKENKYDGCFSSFIINIGGEKNVKKSTANLFHIHRRGTGHGDIAGFIAINQY